MAMIILNGRTGFRDLVTYHSPIFLCSFVNTDEVLQDLKEAEGLKTNQDILKVSIVICPEQFLIIHGHLLCGNKQAEGGDK